MGEAALAGGDAAAAIDHLQRVVAVSPDHTEVRQRLADILCQQAEQMLVAGRDEDALKAIHAARGYTPEDEALYERYTQVCSQVKGGVLARLLERASAEWKRQNWSEAIACLEEYLEFEPDSGDVRIRLDDLRVQQRQAKFSSVKAQAQSMEKAERWDEAIATWQEYLALQPEDRPQAEAALFAAQAVIGSVHPGTNRLRKGIQQAIPLLRASSQNPPIGAARLLAEAIVKDRLAARFAALGVAALVFVSVCRFGCFGPRRLRPSSRAQPPILPVAAAKNTAAGPAQQGR
jgi:tetratricopeptide (TPR) repeat protein